MVAIGTNAILAATSQPNTAILTYLEMREEPARSHMPCKGAEDRRPDTEAA